MTNENEKKTPRKPYSTPMVERIRLAADEAVLGSCKSQSGFFQNWFTDNCGIFLQCQNLGS